MARILVGCADIAGFQSRAARALARAGHQVRYLNTAPHPYNPDLPDEAGVVRCFPEGFRFASRLRQKGGLGKFIGAWMSSCLKWLVFLGSLPRTDVYLFAGRRSFFSSCADLRIIRKFGLRIVHVYLGTDSRPVYLSGIEWAAEGEITPRKLQKIVRRVERQRKRVQTISELASEIIENPLCSQFQSRSCVNWYCIGFPMSAEAFQVEERLEAAGNEDKEGRVRVLHCPSKLATKGTAPIEACLERMKEEGHDVDYVRITNMPHGEVLDQIARCDFVIDQLYSDTPLAGFASEAAVFGKPAVVGGYGWEYFDSDARREWMAPSAVCSPDELDETVRRLLGDADHRRELGAAAQSFVEERWSEEEFAKRMTAVIEGKVPDEWRFDPAEVEYVEGAGMRRERRRELLRALLDETGPEGLGLQSRPGLQAAVEVFAAGE